MADRTQVCTCAVLHSCVRCHILLSQRSSPSCINGSGAPVRRPSVTVHGCGGSSGVRLRVTRECSVCRLARWPPTSTLTDIMRPTHACGVLHSVLLSRLSWTSRPTTQSKREGQGPASGAVHSALVRSEWSALHPGGCSSGLGPHVLKGGVAGGERGDTPPAPTHPNLETYALRRAPSGSAQPVSPLRKASPS